MEYHNLTGQVNMKKYFKQVVFSLVLAIVGISFSPMMTLAADWGATYNSATGGINVGIGSNGSMSGGWQTSNPYNLPSGSILGILSNLLFWLLAVFAIMGVIGFVLSGIWYLLSAGDEGMADKGKAGMKWSIVGIIVGLSGFIIMQAVSALLSGGSKTF
ncbi:MAG: hypothetical protein US57_C0004G0022 [Candidatus Moranbacteria bacterium GW2011_GWC2_37_73]|nr:MAG: hypothetical protein UR95_C0002G0078 [Parcubacteria group bacterium GW2011_GWC1_36_108]KKQ01079.1 MAG: hypothetical protein US09_C0003G0079 [Candidatus Moranbacteria bacterium GW2011_GWD1_36_198]KKQ02481.1 MAG: hypothetical protein US10_C0001G0079 [Candidatus Moranbacteria bacterium GW2011_GWD2_36_198]KKQ40139.1 MAG: hypothetical protein US57_C0004G0022 [Candidatus Moranbacteria bacterium GW2011_GWC2_37_73]